MKEYFYINFIETEQKPNEKELFVHLGGLGFLYVDHSAATSDKFAEFTTNAYDSREEAIIALKQIEKALQRKKAS